jgi:hypothetical protein
MATYYDRTLNGASFECVVTGSVEIPGALVVQLASQATGDLRFRLPAGRLLGDIARITHAQTARRVSALSRNARARLELAREFDYALAVVGAEEVRS